jgi:hypothetical protein
LNTLRICLLVEVGIMKKRSVHAASSYRLILYLFIASQKLVAMWILTAFMIFSNSRVICCHFYGSGSSLSNWISFFMFFLEHQWLRFFRDKYRCIFSLYTKNIKVIEGQERVQDTARSEEVGSNL